MRRPLFLSTGLGAGELPPLPARVLSLSLSLSLFFLQVQGALSLSLSLSTRWGARGASCPKPRARASTRISRVSHLFPPRIFL